MKKFLSLKYLVIFCLTLYIFFSTTTLVATPIHPEEAADGIVAGDIVSGRKLPLVYHAYTGALKHYFIAPYIALFGLNLFALRLAALVNALLLLFILYLTVRDQMGKQIAGWLIVLLCTSAPFLQGSKLNFFSEYILLLLCLWGGLYLLNRFISTKNLIYACLALFLFGVGSHAKINFFWYLTGMIGYFLVSKGYRTLLPIRWSKSVALVASFLLGYSMTIVYNIRTKGATVKLFYRLLTGSSTYVGVDNANYLLNLKVRVLQLYDFLKGDIGLTDKLGTFDIPVVLNLANHMVPVLFVAACFFAIYVLVVPGVISIKVKQGLKLYCFIWGITFLGLPLTPSNLDPTHLFMIYPFPQIVMACFFSFLLKKAADYQLARAIVKFILCIVITGGIIFSLAYYQNMKKVGTHTYMWSQVTDEVMEYLSSKGIKKIYSNDWAVGKLVQFLSKENITVRWCNQDPEWVKLSSLGQPAEYKIKHYISEFSEKQDSVYFLRGSLDLVDEYILGVAVSRIGKKIKAEKFFYNNLGGVIYKLYKIY